VELYGFLFESHLNTFQYLSSFDHSRGGQRFLQLLANQIESIRFAFDWAEIGRHVGGKTFKHNFTNAIYEAQTGRPAPTSKSASKQAFREFKMFKSEHKLMVRSWNYLLDLYTKVRNRYKHIM